MSGLSAVLFGMSEAFLFIAAVYLIKKQKKLFACVLIGIKLALYIKGISSLVKKELFSELYIACGFFAGFCLLLFSAIFAWEIYKYVKRRKKGIKSRRYR